MTALGLLVGGGGGVWILNQLKKERKKKSDFHLVSDFLISTIRSLDFTPISNRSFHQLPA
jgi:uncharacterized membrane protein YsdA (DUF1294 family)